MALTTDRVLESLTRLQEYLTTEQYATLVKPGGNVKGSAAPPPMTIALSRQVGSLGAEVARRVGELLGWPVYDHELLDCIAKEKGLSAHLLERLDERHATWLEEAIRTFGDSKGPPESTYHRGLLELLATLGEVGHCIIVGRGAAQLLPAETTLRVRVIAPRPDRVDEVRKREVSSAPEAERWVDAKDRERSAFVQHLARVDPADPMLYDLVLNSKRLGPDGCAALIVQAARSQESKSPKVPVPAV